MGVDDVGRVDFTLIVEVSIRVVACNAMLNVTVSRNRKVFTQLDPAKKQR